MSNQPALPLGAPAAAPAQTPRSAPHNLEAEQALLGAILFDNETFNRITPDLRDHHFYDPVHGRIFAACADMINAGQLADGLTLKERFARDGGIKEIGGAVYLMQLMDRAAPLSAQAQAYAGLILDLAMRRQLIHVGSTITELAQNPPDGAQAKEIIEEAERSLFSLAESGSTNKGFQDFKTAITASIEVATAAKNRGSDVSGISTGFRDVDHLLGGLHGSDLLILAGRPSMGKTAFALNLAMNVARIKQKAIEADPNAEHFGGTVGFFSLEMSGEQLATRILSDFAEIESHRIRQGKISGDEYARLADSAAMLHTLPLHVDETGGISIGMLHNRARRLKRTHGLDLIVVDYLQLVTSSSKRSDGRVQEVSEVTQGLKAMAKDLQVPVLALSQLSRQVESREDKRPQLSDLRESGSIEQDADIVMFVYREEYYLSRAEPEKGTEAHLTWQVKKDAVANRAELIIGKNRHGPIETVHLNFHGQYTRFSSIAR
ncbi:MAG TPA: replicative DNA helicase [Terricaulis sp.]|nr:replicative DNA helicase [Terricaulis sp.]